MIKEIISKEEFDEEVFNTDKLVVVDFWASWCVPCKQMLKVIDKIESEFEDVNFLEVKVDDNKILARNFKIMSVPAILVFKNGEMVEYTTGFKSESMLVELIKKSL